MTGLSNAPETLDEAEKEKLVQKLQGYIEYIEEGDFFAKPIQELLTQIQDAGMDTQPQLDKIKELYDTHRVILGEYEYFSFVVEHCHPTPEEKKEWIEKSLEKWGEKGYEVDTSGDFPFLAEAKAAGVDIQSHLKNIKDLYENYDRPSSESYTSLFRLVVKYCDLPPEEKMEGFERCIKGNIMTRQALWGDPSYLAYLLQDSITAGIIDTSRARDISQGVIDHYVASDGEGFLGGKMVNAKYLFQVGFESGFLDPKEYAHYILEGIKACTEDRVRTRLTELAAKYGILPVESAETDDVARAAKLAEEIKQGE